MELVPLLGVRESSASGSMPKEYSRGSSRSSAPQRTGGAGGLAQQSLADAPLVTKGSMAYRLRRMEGRGLVDRRPEGKEKPALADGIGSACARGCAGRARGTNARGTNR